MAIQNSFDPSSPLTVNEVLGLLRKRWGVSYDMTIVVRNNCIYLHVMWGCLEQKSFHLDDKEYLKQIAYTIDVLNRLGQAQLVRNWLINCKGKPRLGKALSLPLNVDERADEFVLGIYR